MLVTPVLPNLSNYGIIHSSRELDKATRSKDFRMMDDPRKQRVLDIFLFGPLSVVGPDAVNLTPKNQKSKAVLAMLALAPRGSRSRVWLRDKLWSDRREDQASASLRQALLDIRKSLGPDHKHILHAEKYSVTLNMSCVCVDAIELLDAMERGETCTPLHADVVAEQFLEGFDICDPEFEAWLTLERQIWANRFDNSDSTETLPPLKFSESASAKKMAANTSQSDAPIKHIDTTSQRNNWAVGAQVIAADQSYATFLDYKLAQNLLDMGRIPVLKILPEHSTQVFERETTIPLVYRISDVRHGDTVRLMIELLTGDQGISVWSTSQTFSTRELAEPGGAAASGLIAQAVNQIGRYLRTNATQPEMFMAGQLVECINQIFNLSSQELHNAEETLSSLLKLQPDAKIYAWLAFAKSFQIGQRYCPDAAAQISEAHYYASRALEEDEYDPLVLSLVAHVHSYLFSEFDHAASLYERALKIDPEQAIGWDLYATMHAYTGQNRKSFAMSTWAQHLGANTPIAYYFDTTKCMVAALSGQHKLAIEAGNKALVQRPKFNSVLRYLIASHAHLGNHSELETLRAKLNEVEPDFSTDVLHSASYPGLSTEGGRLFLAGLRKAGFDPKS